MPKTDGITLAYDQVCTKLDKGLETTLKTRHVISTMSCILLGVIILCHHSHSYSQAIVVSGR